MGSALIVEDAIRAFLGAGLMGAVAVVCLIVAYRKDREVTEARIEHAETLERLRIEHAAAIEKKTKESTDAVAAERDRCARERQEAAERLEQARRETAAELRARVDDDKKYTNMAIGLQREMLSVSDRMLQVAHDRSRMLDRPGTYRSGGSGGQEG